MRNIIATLLVLGSCFTLNAQQVGTTTITFNDPARSGGFGSGGGPGRQIQTEIYYPASTAGVDVAITSGEYPIVVFGHGFVMSWDAYENIWTDLVANGYIVAFPRTEGGFSPSHADFGKDLAVVVDRLLLLNDDSNSLFFNSLSGKAGICGHSMGGGATFIAANETANIQTIIGLAPAETNPSAVAAAGTVTLPALVLSGSADGVTPEADHHLPIFNALSSTCKYYVSITGGAHCYFANPNFNCDTGEAFSAGGITVTRTEQQVISSDYMIPWLNIYLKDACDDQLIIDDLEANDARTVVNAQCVFECEEPITSLSDVVLQELNIYPNPVTHELNINGLAATSEIVLTNSLGVEVLKLIGVSKIDVSNLPSGVYVLHNEGKSYKLIKR
jgi:predicted dienelactone hydrolase